jgi:hypothetical protein
LKGRTCQQHFSVAAFDENKKVIDWNLFKEKVDKSGAWIRVEKQFTISADDIRYVTFRLIGAGIGKYRFDDITFRERGTDSGKKWTGAIACQMKGIPLGTMSAGFRLP